MRASHGEPVGITFAVLSPCPRLAPYAAVPFRPSPIAWLSLVPSRLRSHSPRGAAAWLARVAPQPLGGSALGKARACLGALLGLFTVGLIGAVAGLGGAQSLLLGPLAASAVLVFALPASPLAQPWQVLGGNVAAALVGVACAQSIPDPHLAAPVAVAAAIVVMFVLRCLHPPGGAVALTAVAGGPEIHALGYGFVLVPVGLSSVLLLLGAVVFNNLTRHRYPRGIAAAHDGVRQAADPSAADRLGVAPADLESALGDSELLDVSRADLEDILARAHLAAFRRRFGPIRCEDLMTREVVSVTPRSTLSDASALLRRHRIKALPIVGDAGHVVGIVTAADLATQAAQPRPGHTRRASWWRSGQDRDVLGPAPVRIGEIMSYPVRTVRAEQPMTDLYPLMADHGHHHIPVTDAQGKLVGMVTQSDLVAAIYRRGLGAAAGLYALPSHLGRDGDGSGQHEPAMDARAPARRSAA